jgi:hypothetical protein
VLSGPNWTPPPQYSNLKNIHTYTPITRPGKINIPDIGSEMELLYNALKRQENLLNEDVTREGHTEQILLHTRMAGARYSMAKSFFFFFFCLLISQTES